MQVDSSHMLRLNLILPPFPMPTLADLKPSQSAVITRLPDDEQLAVRLCEMGLLRGTAVTFIRSAPLGDPMEFRLRGFELSIRRADAARVSVELSGAAGEEVSSLPAPPSPPAHVVPPAASRTVLAVDPDHPSASEQSPLSVRPKSYAVVGNPNSGKTTLFNALTGLRQKVANYPGVTVEKKSGQFIGQHGEKIELLDLPGSYSIGGNAPDERITRDVLLDLRQDTPRPGRILCVIDAAHLERNLYFVTQVLELGVPTVIALNMIDVARARGPRSIPWNSPKRSACRSFPCRRPARKRSSPCASPSAGPSCRPRTGVPTSPPTGPAPPTMSPPAGLLPSCAIRGFLATRWRAARPPSFLPPPRRPPRISPGNSGPVPP